MVFREEKGSYWGRYQQSGLLIFVYCSVCLLLAPNRAVSLNNLIVATFLKFTRTDLRYIKRLGGSVLE